MTTPQQPAEPPLRLGPVRPKPKESTAGPTAAAPEPTGPTVQLGAIAKAAVDPAADATPDSTVQLAPNAIAEAMAQADGTVRLDPQIPVKADSTVQLAPNAIAEAMAQADATVRLDPQTPVRADSTVRLEPKLPVRAGSTVQFAVQPAGEVAEATVRLDHPAPGPVEDVASATFLDPSVWGRAASSGEDGLRRVGPGVPPQAAALWHGTVQQEPAPQPERRRKRWGWLLPLVVLLAVLAYLAWHRLAPATTVTGVTVSTDAAGPSCDGTAVVTGSLETKGRAGTVQYHWLRSDGTDSGTLSQAVPSGHHSTAVVLRWTFQGHGTMHATATLEVLSPSARAGAVSFTYSCP